MSQAPAIDRARPSAATRNGRRTHTRNGRATGRPDRLADAEHPLVRETAARLGEGCATPREKVERFVLFVRDEILFGFPPDFDWTPASETLRLGYGQCNTKGTLMLALCKAASIPARMHFAPIRKSIQRGLFTGPGYWLMPRRLSHGWLEVQIDGVWRRVDAYINDAAFCQAAARENQRRGWQEGFSVSGNCTGAEPVFDLDAEQFVQMGAIEGDHGVWSDPADYYRSDKYLTQGERVSWIRRRVVPRVNHKIERLRASVTTASEAEAAN
jgi:Transglutaminase-like superfamily